MPIINEANDENIVPIEGFSSENPSVMHACGHDGHASMGLGVAKIIAEIKEQLRARFALYFNQERKGARGASAMVAAGAVDGVDYILGAHLGFQAKKMVN